MDFKKNIGFLIVCFSILGNVNAQCPTVAPTGVPECRLGTGTVTLGASGSTGYSWYDASSGGNFLGVGSTYQTPVISSTTDYFVAAANANYSLNFDGSNDFVDLGNPAALQITGDLTIEMWLKPSNFSARRNPYAKAYGGEGTITQETTGILNYYYGTSGADASPYQGFGSVAALTLNEWNHIAIVRDLTNGQLYWYLNGVLTNQVAADYGAAVAGANSAFIGAGYVSNYAGEIDELRIWSTARTQAEIQTNINLCALGTEPNLVAYYDFVDGAGTVLTDKTANALNGTLTNMDPVTDWVIDSPDISCESCESARTTVTATVNAGVPVNLGADRCFDVSALLDAGAGFSSYLWQDGSTNQTFTATVSGTYFVEANDGGGCVDRDTVSLILNPVSPTGTPNCRLGTGTVNLSASGSSGNYNWYDASTAGNLLGSGASFITPSISTTTDFYVSAVPTNYSLDFDGANDFVDLGNPQELQISGDMTIEMWVKPTNFSTRRNPYAKAYGGEGTITQETTGILNYYYGTSGADASPYQGFGSVAALTLNEWNHIAIVRDLTNGQLYWYINGTLTNQVAADYVAATLSSSPATIAAGYVNNYAGQIDELRVWKSARTQAEVQSNMNTCCDCLANANLAGYWDFNDGTGNSVLSDLTSNGNSGALTNMDAASDWLTDASAQSCEACESPRVAVTATVSVGTPVNLGADENLACNGSRLLDAGAGYASYLWQDGSTSQTFNATTGGIYWVQVDDGGGCIDQDTVKLIDAASAQFALDMDGVNDYVDIENPATLQIIGDQTIEMWLYPRSFASRQNPYNKAYGGEGTFTQETSGVITYFYGTSGADATPYQGFDTGISLNLNEWNHVALVRDLTNMQLYWYVNGVQTNTVAANYAAAVASVSPVLLGAGYQNNYNGQMDEVRIWNVARTQAEIRDNMGKRLIGTELGLAAYYRFDDGAGTTLLDETNNSLNGTLTNMDPATDWITSTAPIGDFTASLFTGAWAGEAINLTPCGRDDVTISNVSGTPTGVLLYYVGTVPNDVTGIVGVGSNDRYFGIRKFNDNAATYTITYNYLNNPHVDLSDEANFALFSRADNAATPWVDAVATVDVVANTLTATAQSTEFMLGSNGVPLPVTLVDFSGLAKRDKISLTWSTASEKDNDYFTIQRSINGELFIDIAQVTGVGTSGKLNEYEMDDFTAPQGNVYYRLLQTDFDGTTTVHKTIMVNYEGVNKPFVNLFPNPSTQNQQINVRGGNFIASHSLIIETMDVFGNIINTKQTTSDAGGYFSATLNALPSSTSGFYLVRITDETSSIVIKLILE
ncbi:MAG: T9SS type A sorting domain-containing protein [Cyclobacteriaceae bacterium]|nr:T9SS type A sorting domain-containing protein [Cyclobacteriaceae bacterium]